MRYFLIMMIMSFVAQVPMIGLNINSALAQNDEKKQVEQKPVVNEQLENRIDFGNSYILGQTIKSGAVYLLQRKQSEIESMLEYRKDYRKEILDNFQVSDINTK